MLRQNWDNAFERPPPMDLARKPLDRNVFMSSLEAISTYLPSNRSALIKTSARRLRSAMAFLPPSSDAVIADEKLSIWALRTARSTVGLGQSGVPFVPVSLAVAACQCSRCPDLRNASTA